MKNKVNKKGVSSQAKLMMGVLGWCFISGACEALTAPLNPAVQRLSDSLTYYESLAKQPWQTLHLAQRLTLDQDDPAVPRFRGSAIAHTLVSIWRHSRGSLRGINE